MEYRRAHFNDVTAHRIPLADQRCFVVALEHIANLRCRQPAFGPIISVEANPLGSDKLTIRFEWTCRLCGMDAL